MMMDYGVDTDIVMDLSSRGAGRIERSSCFIDRRTITTNRKFFKLKTI